MVSVVLMSISASACGDAFSSSPPGGGNAGSGGGSMSGSGGTTTGIAGSSLGGSSGIGGGQGAGMGGASGATAGAGGTSTGTGGSAGAGGVVSQGGSAGSAGKAGTSGVGGKAGSGGGCAVGFVCLGDALQSCDLTSGKYVTVQVCKAGLCDAKLGQCDDCTAGAPVSCADGATVKTCGTNGKPGPSMACPAGKPNCVGKGQCVECVMASQCPAPAKECDVAVCGGNACGAAPAAVDTPAKTQQPHDCARNVCDGTGGVKSVADPSDLPGDTGDPCNLPACNGATPGTTPAKAGTACNAGVGVCNGVGACGECVPGQTRCQGNASQACDASGHWGGAVACAKPAPVCSAGACVAVTSVTAGIYHTCAILADKRVRCWGLNLFGELGSGKISPAQSLQPVVVVGVSDVTTVSGGAYHTCASTLGGVFCWGGNSAGQLGDGQTGATSGVATPQPVAGVPPAVALASGVDHTCALAASGDVYCWGDNSQGQLGAAGPGPLLLQLAEPATAIVAGQYHTCALLQSGKASCWGSNQGGNLGNGTPYTSSLPGAVVMGFDGGVALTAGYSHTCGSAASGKVYCWGDGAKGQFGAVTGQLTVATEQPGLAGWKMLVGGKESGCGLGAGNLQCAGNNAQGQAGVGVTSALNGSVNVLGLDGPPSELSTQYETVCAVVEGDVRCWGYNFNGQIGDGTNVERDLPTAVVW